MIRLRNIMMISAENNSIIDSKINRRRKSNLIITDTREINFIKSQLIGRPLVVLNFKRAIGDLGKKWIIRLEIGTMDKNINELDNLAYLH